MNQDITTEGGEKQLLPLLDNLSKTLDKFKESNSSIDQYQFPTELLEHIITSLKETEIAENIHSSGKIDHKKIKDHLEKASKATKEALLMIQVHNAFLITQTKK